MRRSVPCVLAGLVLWLGGSAASAQVRTAVLGVEPVDAPSELAEKVGDALRAQVRQSSGFRLIVGKSLEEMKLVFGCVDERPDCMARVGRSMGAGKLLWGTLKKSGGGYNLTIKYLDVASGVIEKFISENVSASDLSAAKGPQTVVEKLTRGFLPGGRGGLRISSNVEGAEVQVATKLVGSTQPGGLVVRDLAPGTYEVRISKPGYRTWAQSVVVAAGETAYVDAQLETLSQEGGPEVTPVTTQPAPPATTTYAPRTGWKAAFWTSAILTLGLGGGIVGAGVTVLNKQKEKEDAIGAFVNAHPNDGDSQFFSTPDNDACEHAEKVGSGAEAIKTACSDGQKWAMLTNVFIGLTVAAAGATGFFYYKAYIQKEVVTTTEEKASSKSGEPSWVVAPHVSPQGAGVGAVFRF